jgi:hypothetical protein
MGSIYRGCVFSIATMASKNSRGGCFRMPNAFCGRPCKLAGKLQGLQIDYAHDRHGYLSRKVQVEDPHNIG